MEALHLMQTYLSEPLSTEETARLAGLTRRHLKRLFQMHLHRQPSAWYLTLRLGHAHALLQQTSRPIAQIAGDKKTTGPQSIAH